MGKPQIRIYDDEFIHHAKSASLGGDNVDVSPTHFDWITEGRGDGAIFFTDRNIKKVVKFGAPPRAVALLLEPYELRPENYEAARELEDYFDAILTHDTYHEAHSYDRRKWRYYPFGGSWIGFDKWGLIPKEKDVSFIVTSKNSTEGHWMRQDILERFGHRLDVFGRDINPVDSKFEALAPYRYSVVVESSWTNGYFTEKLIDCLSVGTTPIYWGSPSTPFRNVLSFSTLDLLWEHLQATGQDSFSEKMRKKDLETAKNFACCEDRIYDMYPDLFGEKK